MRMVPGLLLLLMLVPVQAQETAPIPRQRPAETTPATEPAAGPPAVETPASAAEPAQPEPAPAEPVHPTFTAPEDGAVLPLPLPRPDPAAAEPEVPAVEPVGPPPAEAEAAPAPVKASPPKTYQTACPAVIMGMVEAEALPPLIEGQCGLQSPLSLTAINVNGKMVPLSSPATVSCGMATVLPKWVEAVDGYVFAHEKDGPRIESVTVGTSYMCRNVNNAATGNLSDHAFGDAMDVVGFKLTDGRSITVLEGWTGTDEQGSRIVRYAHDAACSLFMTTLGPEANALHHDHLHVDLACHGKSCVSRMCQ